MQNKDREPNWIKSHGVRPQGGIPEPKKVILQYYTNCQEVFSESTNLWRSGGRSERRQGGKETGFENSCLVLWTKQLHGYVSGSDHPQGEKCLTKHFDHGTKRSNDKANLK